MLYETSTEILDQEILATCGDLWLVDHCIRESTRLRTNCDPLLAYPRPPSTLCIHFTLSFPQPGSVEVQWPHIVFSQPASFVVQVYPYWAVRLYSLANVYQSLRCHISEHSYLHSPTMALWIRFVALFNGYPTNAPSPLIVCGFSKETPNKSVYSAVLEDDWWIFLKIGFIALRCTNVYMKFFINHLTPNGHFSGRTAPLTYRCCIFLFIQQIYVLNILNMLHTFRFFLFKMSFIS